MAQPRRSFLNKPQPPKSPTKSLSPLHFLLFPDMWRVILLLEWSAFVGAAASAPVYGTVNVATQRGAKGFKAMLTAYNAVRDTCIFANDYEVTSTFAGL